MNYKLPWFYELVVWPQNHPQLFGVIVTVWSVLWAFTVWDCMSKLASRGVDRLCWLVCIVAVPVLGIILYWLYATDEGRPKRDIITGL